MYGFFLKGYRQITEKQSRRTILGAAVLLFVCPFFANASFSYDDSYFVLDDFAGEAVYSPTDITAGYNNARYLEKEIIIDATYVSASKDYVQMDNLDWNLASNTINYLYYLAGNTHPSDPCALGFSYAYSGGGGGTGSISPLDTGEPHIQYSDLGSNICLVKVSPQGLRHVFGTTTVTSFDVEVVKTGTYFFNPIAFTFSGADYDVTTYTDYASALEFMRSIKGSGIPSIGTHAGFRSDANTRFLEIFVSGSSTISVDVDYYLDPDEVDTSISLYNPTSVRFAYSLRPSTNLTGLSEAIDPTDTGTSTVSFNLGSLADGVYDLEIKFNNAGCALGLSGCPFPNTYVYTDFTISGGTLTATGTIEYYNARSFENPNGGVSSYPCSLTEFQGCLKNFALWLFQPSDFAINYFVNIVEYLKNKFPAAYVYSFATAFTTFANTSSGTLPDLVVPLPLLGNVTILSADIFNEGSTLETVGDVTYPLSAGAFSLGFMILLFRRSKRFAGSLTRTAI